MFICLAFAAGAGLGFLIGLSIQPSKTDTNAIDSAVLAKVLRDHQRNQDRRP